MRILRIAQKTYPDVKGGGSYHVHALSRDQSAMGHDVTVLTVRTDHELPHIEERNGYTVIRYNPSINLLGNTISSGVARYLYDASDFDVLHAHSHLYFSTNLSALKRRLGDIPLAITNHGLYSQTAPKWVFDRYLRTVGRWTFNQADVVFCYTDIEKRRLIELGVETEIDVIPNGVDVDRFTSARSQTEQSIDSSQTILFVGRLVEGKNPDDAIAAFSKLIDHNPDSELLICGDGPLRDELEESVPERISDRVDFLGHLPYEEMPAVYRDADVLVLPSETEGFPRTVIEAIASETPVVTATLPQVEPVLSGRGQMASTGDIDALATAIEAQLEREEIQPIPDQLSWRSTVEQTTSALADVRDETSK